MITGPRGLARALLMNRVPSTRPRWLLGMWSAI